jgi:hypothetical protein
MRSAYVFPHGECRCMNAYVFIIHGSYRSHKETAGVCMYMYIVIFCVRGGCKSNVGVCMHL